MHGIDNRKFGEKKAPKFFEWNPDDATIWLNPIDAAIISFLPHFISFKTRNFVEVGVYRGGLVRTFLQNNSLWSGFGIDPYPGLNQEKVRCFEILEKARVRSRFRLFDNWQNFLDNQALESASVIHIDGEHSESAAFEDLNKSLEMANSSTIIIVDDFMARIFPGVTSAVFKFLDKSDFSALMISPAKIFLCKSEVHQEYQSRIEEVVSELNLTYSYGFPVGTYDLTYEQSSAINGCKVLIVENQKLTKSFVNTLFRKGKSRFLKEKSFRIVQQILPPIIYFGLKRIKTMMK